MSYSDLGDFKSQLFKFKCLPLNPGNRFLLVQENTIPEIMTTGCFQTINPNDDGKQITKQVKFVDLNSRENTSIPWPKVDVQGDFQPSSKISEIGRIFISHLNKIGLIHATLNTPTFTDVFYQGRQYNCSLNFQIKHGYQRFQIKLTMKYGTVRNKNAISAFISNEELVDYLKDMIIFQKTTEDREIKFRMLRLLAINCFINDLELEI